MTVERESPEATICGQLLIVRNTLSLLPRLHSSFKSPHTGLFTYFFVFANKVTNNLDKFHFPTSRDRESPAVVHRYTIPTPIPDL
jgi:hypothetical protein